MNLMKFSQQKIKFWQVLKYTSAPSVEAVSECNNFNKQRDLLTNIVEYNTIVKHLT
jgi:hypothetical protein